MAQEFINDWVDEPDDWTTVDDWVEEPAQSSIPTRPVEVSVEEPGLLKRAWDVANEPLLNIDTSNDFGKAPVNESPNMARVKGFFGGAGEAVGDVLSSFTSPINLAAMGLTGGSGMLARKGALAGARALGMAAKIPDAGAVAHGATGILDPNTGILDKGFALAEVAGGAAGLRMPLPKLGKPVIPEMPTKLPVEEAMQVLSDPNYIENVANITDSMGRTIGKIPTKSPFTQDEFIVTNNQAAPVGTHIEQTTGIPKRTGVESLPPEQVVNTIPDSSILNNQGTPIVKSDNPVVEAVVAESLQTKKPVPQAERVSPNEEISIGEKPTPTGDPVVDAITWRDYLSVPRAMQSAWDLSFPFRQGIGLAHTKGWWKAWPDMVRSFGKEKAYQSVMDSITERPNFQPGNKGRSFAEEAGLFLTDLGKLSGREENLGSKIAEKFPLIRASNRAYTAFANKLRADVFDSLIDDATKAGLNPKQNLILARSIADYVNNASGRGNLGSLESSAVTLNNLLFSPRLMASRLQMMNPANYAMSQPFVRKQYWKSLGSLVGAYSTFTALNNMAGGTTGTDDPLSSDFGRTQIGNSRFDPSGGILPYLTLFARIGQGMADKATGDKGRYDDKFPFNTPQGDAGQFLENKASPIFSQLLKLGGADKNRPFEAGDQALRMFTPIMIQDLSELLKEDPSMAPFGVAQSAIGIGVNTYEKGKPPDRLLPEALDPLSGGNDFTIPRSFQRR